MSRTTLLASLAGAVAGALGGAVVAGTLASAPAEPTRSEPAVALPGADLDALRDTVAALRDQNASLERRLSDLERFPLDAGSREVATVDGEPPAAEAVLTDAQLAAIANELGRSEESQPSPVLTAQVNAALQKIRDQEEAEREAEREERALQMIDERVARLTEELGLAGWQATEMRDAMRGSMDRMEALRDRMRDEDVPRDDARELFRQARDGTEQAYRNILTPEQYRQYEAMDDRRWGGDRDRRGGGGPGGF